MSNQQIVSSDYTTYYVTKSCSGIKNNNEVKNYLLSINFILETALLILGWT